MEGRMGSFSIWHWLIVLVLLVPVAKILKKAGFSPWWAILAIVPIANLVGLFVFAFIRWPSKPAPVDASVDASS